MDQKAALELIDIRLDAIRETLAESTRNDKTMTVSVPIAKSFNSIAEDLKKLRPDMESAIPPPISTSGDAAQIVGQTDIRFLDLEIMLRQMVRVRELIK